MPAWSGPVGRGRYLAVGLSLAVLKYAGDWALVRWGSGQTWTVIDYIFSAPALLSWRFSTAQPWLLPSLVVWALAFVAIGVSFTRRRAIDAGWSPWITLAFFVPFVNYALIASLCMAGTKRASPDVARPPASDGSARARAEGPRWADGVLALLAGLSVGIVMVLLSTRGLEFYGLALIVGSPFVLGALTGWIFNRRHPATGHATAGLVVLTLAATAIPVMVVALEGLVCLAMVMPLALPLAIFGGTFGRGIALEAPDKPLSILPLLILPVWAVAEPGGLTGRTTHEVQTAIEIDAPPEAVWTRVVAFPPLPAPTDLVFRAGVAFPVSARIDGAGVGAIRYCEFSTGAFVEPITGWDRGRRLSFDVVKSPPPMRELTIVGDARPPHLDGFLRPRRGEFRLVPLPNGRTRLEGSTWYELEMAPEGYWQLWSDALIGRIHARVLEHIKRESERAPR